MKVGKNHNSTTRKAMTIAASVVALAMTQKAAFAQGDSCNCVGCSWGSEHVGPTLVKGSAEYFDYIEPSGTGSSTTPGSFVGTQVVYLDFDSATGGSDYVYTGADRTAVRDGIQATYSDFNISVTNTLPTSGPFSTITFNSGSAGGLADGIDFRNLNMSDNAVVNINGLFTPTAANFVPASIVIGAHELGHILGFRHGDSYGSIGNGIVPGNVTPYGPDYPGPTAATETGDNIMASPASVGSSLANLLTPTSLSARSATKLAFAQTPTVTPETGAPHGTLGTAQALTLPTISIPNTALPTDALFGQPLAADVEVITGEISVGGETDLYSFTAEAGDLFNIEVMSSVFSGRFGGNAIDSTVAVLDGTGTQINYYGSSAFNDDELEGLDSILIDLIIPADGTYFIDVGTFSGGDTGGYELYVSRFKVVPEPGSFALVLVLSAGVLSRRRRAA